LGNLLGQLTLLLAAWFVLWFLRIQWLSLGVTPPRLLSLIFWLLIFGILLAIGSWLFSLPKFGPRDALVVGWEEQYLSLLAQVSPREKRIELISWEKVVRLTLPPYPGRGIAELFIADETEPYHLHLAEDGDCLAFLGLMQSKGLLA
jgi:hypothetical protein